MKKNFLFLIFGIFPSFAFCDMAPVEPVQSGCVNPIFNNDVKLQSEVVNITLFQDYYQVEVNYIFINTGEEQKVTMGFPNEESGETTKTIRHC